MKRTGFIAIVGRPNVGKSTLLNGFLGEKVAITSSKPQTTRTRILGILTEEEDQYVFLDTPGIHRPQNSLGEYMVKAADATMKEADAIVLVCDVSKKPSKVETDIFDYARENGVPVVLALNKIDLVRREQIAETIAAYAALHTFAAVVPIAAKNGKNVKELLAECKPFLSGSEWYFPPDMVTDQPERVIASEIIREKILRSFDKEVPHGVAVVIEDFSEEGNLLSVRAEIFCEKASHKGIIVGKKGDTLKMIGTYAREDMEKVFGKKVYLNLWVKVKENWRDSVGMVQNFGYNGKEDL